MCGLVGLAGTITAKNKDIFHELLLVDVVRGSHSTGAASVRRFDNEIKVAKGPLSSPFFINTKEYRDAIDNNGLKCIIGHNRYATVGLKNAENAHPFKFDGMVGAHNGTLDDWALRRLDKWTKFGTDSEALFYNLNTNGLKPTIESLTGAWALTWFDSLGSSINLLRNNKRPLYYAYSEDREVVYWASEADMLEWVVKRNGVKLFDNSVFHCDPDIHYKWEIPKSIGGKFEKPVCAKVEGALLPVFTRRDGGSSYRDAYMDSEYTTYGFASSPPKAYTQDVLLLNPPKPKPQDKHEHKKLKTDKFRPPYKDAYHRVINKENFEKLIKTGCVYCDEANSKWGDFIFPLKDDMEGRKLYLCKECYEDDEIRQLVDDMI
jgi:hypothetical protein